MISIFEKSETNYIFPLIIIQMKNLYDVPISSDHEQMLKFCRCRLQLYTRCIDKVLIFPVFFSQTDFLVTLFYISFPQTSSR